MIAHSNNFKEAITRLGRDLHVKIEYLQCADIITEDNKLLITQDNLKFITETPEGSDYQILDEDEIISLKRNNLGELFRTYMKSYDLESTFSFNVGDKAKIYIGTTVNNEIEYIYTGQYYVYEKAYNEESKTYTYTLCDRMLFTMQKYDNDLCFGNELYLGVYQLITNILVKQCGFASNEIYLDGNIGVNDVYFVGRDTFAEINITCRDVLDMLVQANGCSLAMNEVTQRMQYRTISNTSVDTLDEDILDISKIKMEKKFGEINSLVFSRADGFDNIERRNQSSIDTNGLTQYVIKDNLFLDNLSDTYRQQCIDNLFDVMQNIGYYICDINTIGIGYIEYLDKFTISANGNTYETICLENTNTISNGMSESFKSEAVKEEQQTFENITADEKTATINLNKLKGEIVLKTKSDGRLAQVRLDSSPEEGSLVEIKGTQIKLEGATTINEYFYIDTDGYMHSSNGGDIANWNISDDALYKDVTIGGTDYRVYIQSPLSTYDEDTWIFSIQKKASSDPDYLSTYYVTLGGDIYGRNIYYHNLVPVSLEEEKKDFELLENGLDIIKDIDIYKFRYKDEYGTKKHIGFVIGNDYKYSQEITANNNDGADLYSFVSVCCKAIQEQQKEIEELKKEIQKKKEDK